ncbi:hypothetical protein ACSQ67_024833 [Phaseolus vulgaris]
MCLQLQQPSQPPPPAHQRMPITLRLQSRLSPGHEEKDRRGGHLPFFFRQAPRRCTRRTTEVPLSPTSSCSRGGGGDFGRANSRNRPRAPLHLSTPLRGWRQVESENLAVEDVMDESVHRILGNYLVRRHKHRERIAKEKPAPVNEVAKPREELDRRQAVVSEVAHLKEEMARLGQHFLGKENALNEELRVVRNAEREANKNSTSKGGSSLPSRARCCLCE